MELGGLAGKWRGYGKYLWDSVRYRDVDMVELGGLAGKWRGYMELGQLERQS